MPVSVKVELRGIDRTLKKMAGANFKTPLKQSGTYMERQIGMRFREAKWKPLSPTTLKWHPRRMGGKPLNDTGRLKMSVTSQAIKKVSETQLTYGTNLVYAGVQNFGGKVGLGKRLPARPFLYFDNKDEINIRRVFEDYMKELSK